MTTKETGISINHRAEALFQKHPEWRPSWEEDRDLRMIFSGSRWLWKTEKSSCYDVSAPHVRLVAALLPEASKMWSARSMRGKGEPSQLGLFWWQAKKEPPADLDSAIEILEAE